MSNAQTEARAIARASLWVPAKPEHAKIGWTYDFEQTKRISRAAYDSTGYDATMEVVEFVMAEADRRHDTALEAQAAELADFKAKFHQAIAVAGLEKERAERAEAQLAEANRKIAERDKALANYDRWLNGRDAYIVQKGLWQNFVASLPGSPTARRALEEQGGE